MSTKGAKFKKGDKVLVRVYGSNCKWQPAIVTAVRDRVYVLRTQDRAISRHQSQIRRRYYDSVVDKQQAVGPAQGRAAESVTRFPFSSQQEERPALDSGATIEEPSLQSEQRPALRRSNRLRRFTPYITTSVGRV